MTDTRKQWTGRVLSALAVMFLIFDGVIKLTRHPMVLEASAQLGLRPATIIPIGILLLACTLVYMIPRTRIVGAVLLTGYLGGAVATQVRVGNPVFETLFPIIVAAVVWAGLFVRDQRLRALVAAQP